MREDLTQAYVANVKPGPRPYDIADAKQRGLTLRVRPSGKHSWIVRLNVPGRWYTIGASDVIPPALARARAKDLIGQVAAGKDPIQAKKEKRDQARTTREAERAAREAARVAATEQARQEMTLGTYIRERYAPWATANRKTGVETVQILESRCLEFLDVPMVELTPFAVERWRLAYLKRGRKQATVNRVLVALKGCLTHAVKVGKVLRDHPLADVKLADVDRFGRLRYLKADEDARLMAALAARDDKRRAERESGNAWRRERGLELRPSFGRYTDNLTPLVVVLLHTGLRFGEACSLTWGDVDLVTAQLTVRGETAKTNRTRYVPLNTTAVSALKAWMPDDTSPDAFVFPGKDGERLVDIKTAWRQTVTAAKVQGFRIHDLRHSFASRLVQAGVDLNTVRELLGHADIKMTLRYAHLAPEHRAAAVAKIG